MAENNATSASPGGKPVLNASNTPSKHLMAAGIEKQPAAAKSGGSKCNK
jgi:hypothetical protein